MREDSVGNSLYTLLGDNSIVSNENGALFVRVPWGDYYTTAAGTKGDWLFRQYGNSIVVRGYDGSAYARFDGDWYISLLPRIEPSSSTYVAVSIDTANAKMTQRNNEAGVNLVEMTAKANDTFDFPPHENIMFARELTDEEKEAGVTKMDTPWGQELLVDNQGRLIPGEEEKYNKLFEYAEKNFKEKLDNLLPNKESRNVGSNLLNEPLYTSAGKSYFQPTLMNFAPSYMSDTYLNAIPEYTPVNYQGVVFNLYSPVFPNEINSDEWQTIDGCNTVLKGFKWAKFIADIAFPNVNAKPLVEAGDKYIYSHQPSSRGVGMLGAMSMVSGVASSASQALEVTPVQVIVQQKAGVRRIIVQIGLHNELFQNNADNKTVIVPVETVYDGTWMLKFTFDQRRAQDTFSAYIMIDDNGQMFANPKVYSGDKIEIGKLNFFLDVDKWDKITWGPTIINQDLAEEIFEVIKPFTGAYL